MLLYNIMVNPEFRITVENIAGVPHIITVTPQAAGNLDGLTHAAYTALIIRNAVTAAVQHYNGMTRYRTLQLGAFINCITLTNLATHTFDQVHHVADITPDFILAVTESIAESGTPFDPLNTEWVVTLEPADIRAGGAQIVKMPKWGTNVATWRSHSDNQGPINCGAFALTWVLAQREYGTSGTRLTRAIDDARELQTKLGWGPMVQQRNMQLIVDLYPEYRITVLIPGANLHTTNTWCGKDFVFSADKCLYVILDVTQHHFAACKSPQELMRKYHNSDSWRWCHNCVCKFQTEHICEEIQVRKKPKIEKVCKCGIIGTHQCPLFTCRVCKITHLKNAGQRCPVITEERREGSELFVGMPGIEADGKHKAIWAYDMETRFESKITTTKHYEDFGTENGVYVEATVETSYMDTHIPCLLVACNPWSDEDPLQFWGDDCVKEFLEYLLMYNKNNNICYAHNGSGYDTRLIFQAAVNMHKKVEIVPILRGTKFVKLKFGKTLFHDSMLHCPGSLKKLLKDFAPAHLQKGFYPYRYTKSENFDLPPLDGPPPIEMFGLQKTDADRQALEKWHNEWTAPAPTGFVGPWKKGPWYFKRELLKYCIMDTVGLGYIIKGVNDILVTATGMSPWLKTTAPSFVHEVIGVGVTRDLELPETTDDMDLYQRKLDEGVKNSWAVLQPFEYFFARKALYGGRTDVKQLSCELTTEQIAAGCRIVYQDITSQYPYQQMVHKFPVGIPTIQFWGEKYAPCFRHGNSLETVFCECEGRFIPKESKTHKMLIQPTEAEVHTWFGIGCVTLIPPEDLLIPVFVFFDKKSKKSLSTLCPENHVEMWCTSVELQKGLEIGYELKTVHRFDHYKKAPSLWSDKMGEFYLEKLLNSSNAPATEELKQKLIDDHREFGNLSNLIAASWARWGKNGAKKFVAKIMMNSMWGKHAQRPEMPNSKVIDHTTNPGEVDDFFQNFQKGAYKSIDANALSDSRVMYRYMKESDKTNPDLHGGYLPAAVFVTAYARRQLFTELHKLGKRVLYHDTDSIIYIYDPREYNIPFGDILGQWSEEDISKPECHGGIKKFIALGPKTYGILCHDGTESIKTKGISLGLATSQQVNFKIMDEMVDDYIMFNERRQVQVFQPSFHFNFKDGMRTRNMKKLLKINPDDFKGQLINDFMYPFGYKGPT